MAGRLFLHTRRGHALVATLTAQQLLPDTVQLPVLCHCLLGLSLEAACGVVAALAAAAGLGSWRGCHLDHVYPLALQDAQTQLGTGLSLRNLRPLLPAHNMAIGSRGLSRVQGRAGLPPLCRRLPGGEEAGPVESQQALAQVEAEAQQHDAALQAQLQQRGHTGACPCGPCRLAAAPGQPFVSQLQADEVRQQQFGALWICACAEARAVAGGEDEATRVPGYSQPWSMSAFLRHGGTGCSQLHLPLVPPLDGYGAGMGAELAGELAQRGVQLYMQLAAQRREAADLPPLPPAVAEPTAAALRSQLRKALMALRRHGEAERELTQAEEAAELAWAAAADGDEALAAAAAGTAAAAADGDEALAAAAAGTAAAAGDGAEAQPAAGAGVAAAAGDGAESHPAAGAGAAAAAAAAAAGQQQAAAPPPPEAAAADERERLRLARQRAEQQVLQYRAQQAQQAQQQEPGQQQSFLPPSRRRTQQPQQPQQPQQRQQRPPGVPGTGRRTAKRARAEFKAKLQSQHTNIERR